jgi:hypothetical protein
MALGSLVLHTALGLRRPFDRTYLAFACIMACVAVFLYLQAQLYAVTTADVAVEVKRHQVTVVNVFFACMLVFVPAYSRVQLPRAIAAALWIGIAIVFVANLLTPYGLWFGGEPQLVPSTFHAEAYTSSVAPPMGALQIAYAGFVTIFLLVALSCAVRAFRGGRRQRGLALAIALALVLVHGSVDIIRDNIGASWPYVAEYGVVSWGLIMSMQLAHEFRTQTQQLARAISLVEAQSIRLTAILEALQSLEQNMHTPLDKLEAGVARLGDGTPDAQLVRIERAVTRLRVFARSMPNIHARRNERLAAADRRDETHASPAIARNKHA